MDHQQAGRRAAFLRIRHGKAAVLDTMDREVPRVFRIFSFVVDTV